MNAENPDNIIRISHEEVASEHVDDMLKRQMSLRGDPGVTRSQGRNWFLQNWFIFMIVGMLGAVTAWAIIEPYFDDQIYFQGEITSIDLDDELNTQIPKSENVRQIREVAKGSIVVKDQKIWLLTNAKEIRPDGSLKRLYESALHEGETVGVYLQYIKGPEDDLALASFVKQSPPPQSPERAKKTLDQLQARNAAASFLMFPLIAGLIGLFIGAADGIICRLPRRAILSGLVGLLVGFIGGFISHIIANLAYTPLHNLALAQSGETSLGALGFTIQMIGRSLAWCLAGMAMGLGQGIALRSKRLLMYGFLGGIIGGLLGGLLFDPIDLIFLGEEKPSAHWSRLIGFAVIGLGVGAAIGVVELLARDAWLRMTQGPLTGKEFLLFKDVMNIGSSPRSDLYLFNDPLVAENHALIRAVGDECEIETRHNDRPVFLNNRPLHHARLRHGDQITIGRTTFVFQRRKG